VPGVVLPAWAWALPCLGRLTVPRVAAAGGITFALDIRATGARKNTAQALRQRALPLAAANSPGLYWRREHEK